MLVDQALYSAIVYNLYMLDRAGDFIAARLALHGLEHTRFYGIERYAAQKVRALKFL